MKRKTSRKTFDFPKSPLLFIVGIIVAYLSLRIIVPIVPYLLVIILIDVFLLGSAMGSYRMRDYDLFWFLIGCFSLISFLLLRAILITNHYHSYYY
ncbi:hypothetical protein [Candidatus Uabimicrobium amorphum]|uniref:hypothetical protein n=1 Tax=Uabimicrobium amorphum TaxID=2596890 RepID=UPI00125F9496|nr:hypothetical protein [Candidatus Uabimicrobium amorphum]